MSFFVSFFVLLSIIYILIGLSHLYRIIANWSSFIDEELTQQDARLASAAAFYFLIPIMVLLHELGHAVMIWAHGLEVEGFLYFGYMGMVYHAPTTPLAEFLIALAGNVVTLLVGVVSILFPLTWPGHPVRNILLIELGRLSLILVLFFYPVICIFFPGDFQTIYDFRSTPIASTIVALVHAFLFGYGYRTLWKKRWRPRAKVLCSNAARELIAAEQALRARPDDPKVHEALGIIYVAARELRPAKYHLERVLASVQGDAQLHLAYGTILAESGQPNAAIEHLERSIPTLIRPEERNDALAVLADAKLSAQDPEGALEVLTEVREKYPEHLRSLEIWVQAMGTLDRKDEAREVLDGCLEKAEGKEKQRLMQMLRILNFMKPAK